ncbi:SDR family NAD(P)-dependent oxidoreductase, partial [Rhizobiaceae sp. 2RAB30]
ALAVALLPVLVDNKPAAIVNLTSALAVAPKAAAPVYCATKAAVRNFSRGLRYQCEDAALGVSVIEVVMALVDTGMTRGRGKGKISPGAAARHVIDAIERGRDEVWVGATRIIRALHRISPRLAERVLRQSVRSQ